jgi:SAM-dependent methyltransferase
MDRDDESGKRAVKAFWEGASAGEFWAVGESDAQRFAAEEAARDRFEPYLPPFARFADGAGKDVLEIGVGMGADHARWARARPRLLVGIDLSARSIRFTEARLAIGANPSALAVADAERLPFADATFDLVYSWGVLHHSPDTPRAVAEVYRVLRPGGIVRAMIYHAHSLTGYMLWLRYGLLRGRPGVSLRTIYDRYLESPGTKAYTVEEARALFAGFAHVDIRVQLNYGDLLQSEVGRRHRGPLLSLAKAVWPRRLLRRIARNHGLYLLIEARR